MKVYLNGEVMDESEACVPVTDRGFLFGDAIFETLRTWKGKPLLWSLHAARLVEGAELLNLALPLGIEAIRREVEKLVDENHLSEAVVRITLTRGTGLRGYSPKGANQSTLLITSQSAPEVFGGRGEGWDLVTSHWPVAPVGPLSRVKHANRLGSILARAEADALGAHEALQLSAAGMVAEGSGGNLGWFEGETLVVPSSDTGALPGVMQDYVLQVAAQLKWPLRTAAITREELMRADGVFLTNSVYLLVPIRSLDGQPLRISPITGVLIELLRQRLFGGAG